VAVKPAPKAAPRKMQLAAAGIEGWEEF